MTAAPLPVHRFNGGRPAQAVPQPALRVVKPPSEVDLVAAEQAAAAFLLALGLDLDTESLAATPGSDGPAYAEMFTPRSFDLTTFGNDAAYDELIIARSIPVQSVCEHHLLPFLGVAHVGYLGSGSLAFPSWLEWSSCSRAAPRCKNGSPSKSPTGSKTT